MGLAFWRSKKRAGNASAKPATRQPLPQDEDASSRLDSAATLRARARHRLIGAAALLLAVAIIVPMLLDPEPRPVAENIPIDIPSERTPFAPRLSLPPVPAPDNIPPAPPAEQAPATEAAQPKAETKAPEKADAKATPKADVKAAPKAGAASAGKTDNGEASKAEEQRARAALEGKAAEKTPAAIPASVKGGKFAVQVAAPASEKSARDLADRLRKGGFTTYTEKVDTKDGARYRVRVGPFASREDAERVRGRLKALGPGGNVVTL
jgi:DedD protein